MLDIELFKARSSRYVALSRKLHVAPSIPCGQRPPGNPYIIRLARRKRGVGSA
jgi:hypothetical protein